MKNLRKREYRSESEKEWSDEFDNEDVLENPTQSIDYQKKRKSPASPKEQFQL